MNFQPEEKNNSEQKTDGMQVSQHRSKPTVMCRIFLSNHESKPKETQVRINLKT